MGGTQSSPTATTEWEQATWERRKEEGRKKGEAQTRGRGSTRWIPSGDDATCTGGRSAEESGEGVVTGKVGAMDGSDGEIANLEDGIPGVGVDLVRSPAEVGEDLGFFDASCNEGYAGCDAAGVGGKGQDE